MLLKAFLLLPIVLFVALRKLEAKRRNENAKLDRRGIVKAYTDYSSQTNARWTRRDAVSNRNTLSNELKSHYLDTYEGLNPHAATQIEWIISI